MNDILLTSITHLMLIIFIFNNIIIIVVVVVVFVVICRRNFCNAYTIQTTISKNKWKRLSARRMPVFIIMLNSFCIFWRGKLVNFLALAREKRALLQMDISFLFHCFPSKSMRSNFCIEQWKWKSSSWGLYCEHC